MYKYYFFQYLFTVFIGFLCISLNASGSTKISWRKGDRVTLVHNAPYYTKNGRNYDEIARYDTKLYDSFRYPTFHIPANDLKRNVSIENADNPYQFYGLIEEVKKNDDYVAITLPTALIIDRAQASTVHQSEFDASLVETPWDHKAKRTDGIHIVHGTLKKRSTYWYKIVLATNSGKYKAGFISENQISKTIWVKKDDLRRWKVFPTSKRGYRVPKYNDALTPFLPVRITRNGNKKITVQQVQNDLDFIRYWDGNTNFREKDMFSLDTLTLSTRPAAKLDSRKKKKNVFDNRYAYVLREIKDNNDDPEDNWIVILLRTASFLPDKNLESHPFFKQRIAVVMHKNLNSVNVNIRKGPSTSKDILNKSNGGIPHGRVFWVRKRSTKRDLFWYSLDFKGSLSKRQLKNVVFINRTKQGWVRSDFAKEIVAIQRKNLVMIQPRIHGTKKPVNTVLFNNIHNVIKDTLKATAATRAIKKHNLELKHAETEYPIKVTGYDFAKSIYQSVQYYSSDTVPVRWYEPLAKIWKETNLKVVIKSSRWSYNGPMQMSLASKGDTETYLFNKNYFQSLNVPDIYQPSRVGIDWKYPPHNTYYGVGYFIRLFRWFRNNLNYFFDDEDILKPNQESEFKKFIFVGYNAGGGNLFKGITYAYPRENRSNVQNLSKALLEGVAHVTALWAAKRDNRNINDTERLKTTWTYKKKHKEVMHYAPKIYFYILLMTGGSFTTLENNRSVTHTVTKIQDLSPYDDGTYSGQSTFKKYVEEGFFR